MSEIIVEMRSITKRFPGVIANEDVSLEIKKGEIYAIIGENGAGKSTLMSMLFGLYEPDEGEIIVRGEKVRITTPAQAAKLSIGMVHQHFRLVENFTIGENIVLGVEPMKRALGALPYVDIESVNKKIRDISREYGLEVDPEALIEDVSVSIRQRVEILKMLYREAEILIFDEPTAMLAPQEVEYLLEILQNLRKSGKTIILITHKLDEIKKTADRCAILNKGRLVSVYDVADTPISKMVSDMVGREVAPPMRPEKREFGKEVLKIENLSLTTGGREKISVLDNINMSVREGEIFAIAGVGGNGQIELTDCIAGLIKSTSGNVFLDGEDITELSVRERVEKGISYVPEDRQATGLLLDYPLSKNLTLRQYYKEPFSKKGVLNEKAIKEFSDDLIQSFDIRSGRGSDTIARSMSGGNQQKAIVAREITIGSRLLVFVQPTRGLDIGAIQAIHAQIVAQRNAGRAVLLISFELDEVMALADTIGVIYNGSINKIAAADDLTVNEVGEYMTGVKQ